MFSQILGFLKDNMLLLVELVLSISVILITLLRKKVKISDVFEMVLTVLPGYIREAELKFSDPGSGTDKYSYVFNKCLELLNLLTGESKQRVIEQYTTKINAAIENILSTPSKKVR